MSAQDPLTPPSAQQDWLTPAKLPQGSATYDTYAAPPAMYELRPLTTSEVLDRTFSLYRSHFWLFAGIASFSGALQAVVAVAQMIFQGRIMSQMQQIPRGRTTVLPFGGVVPIAVVGVGSILHFLSWCIVMAACAFALGEIYLGRSTTIAQSFRATLGRWYAYIGIALWQIGSFLWLPFVLGIAGLLLLRFAGVIGSIGGGLLLFLGFTAGVIVGYIFYLRNAFGVSVAVLERSSVRAAMRRSKSLTLGAKWRALLIWLIFVALLMVVGVLQMPLAFLSMMLMMKGGQAFVTQAVSLIVNFVGYTVVTPIPMIGLTLLYFDQRVRKEAFDIAFLLGEDRGLGIIAPLSTQYGTPPAPPAGEAPFA